MLLTNGFEPDERVRKEGKCLVKNNYDVTIFCWDRSCKYKKSEIIDGIKIIRFRTGKSRIRSAFSVAFGFLKLYKKIISFVKRNGKNYEIIHCNDYDTLFLGSYLKKRMNAKMIYDSHELFFSYTNNHLLNLVFFLIEKMNLKNVDGLIHTNKKRLHFFLINIKANDGISGSCK